MYRSFPLLTYKYYLVEVDTATSSYPRLGNMSSYQQWSSILQI